MVVWRKRESVPEDVRPWLFSIARNIVRNQKRSRLRSDRLSVRVMREPLHPKPGPEAVVIRSAEDQALLDAVEALPDKYAEVVRLWAWEYLTARQIADVVGCSVSASEKRLTRGLGRLRSQLTPKVSHAPHKPMRVERRDGNAR